MSKEMLSYVLAGFVGLVAVAALVAALVVNLSPSPPSLEDSLRRDMERIRMETWFKYPHRKKE